MHQVGTPRARRLPRVRSTFVAKLLAAVTVAGGLAQLSPPPASAAGWTPPGYVRSFGGRGEAGVYAWGMEYDPATGEILVGDYWNFWVRRFSTDGEELGAFYRPVAQRRGQPYSISVDDRNGDVYVSEIGDSSAGYFSRYSATGTFLNEFDSGARYTAWHTISGKYLYVADSHYWNNASSPPRIRIYDLDNHYQPVQSFGSYGTTPGTGQMGMIHGLGVDAGGRIYAADASSRRVHVYTSNGAFLYDFGGPGTGLGQFSTDLRGLVVDQASGAIYVVDAEVGEVEKFQMSADPATTPPTPVAHWGSVGTGPGQMADGGRGITVDGSGNVWIADYGNYRILEYSPSGALLGTFPDPATPPPPGGFSWARDVAIGPQGDVWAADARNNRFQRFGPTGTFLGTWGRRNSKPPYGMDYPRGIGVNPVNGDVWVASTRDHFIRVYDQNANYLGTAGNGMDSTNPGSFRWPLDIEFVNQGGTEYAWIADYTSSRLKRVDTVAPFTERQSISVTNNGVAVDVPNDRIYVLSWRNDNVSVYNLAGTFLTKWGSQGSGTCQFANPWDIDLVDGTLYVTDSVNNRVMAFTTSGSCLGQWGTKGIGPYKLKDPSGITHDAQGNLYVADANNDRIVKYSFSVPLPDGSDQTAPTGAVTSPTAGQAMPASTVTIAGTAHDNTAIGTVSIAVRNRTTLRWWDAKNAVWAANRVWNIAPTVTPTVTDGTFAFSFVGVGYGTPYSTQVQVTDVTGTTFTGALRNFTTVGSGPVDATAPTVTIPTPAKDSVQPAGPIAIGGHASDDVAVATVEVAIRNRVTGQWWQPGTGTWGASLKWFSVALGSPGAPSTTWSTTWSDAASGGSYRVQVRATDTSGNITATPYPFTQFTVA
jgi:hypothetical protein